MAQITDMHVNRRGHVLPHMPHVIGPLRRVLASIAARRERPNLILATGDLVESGRRDEYQRLRDILGELDVPAYLLPGNHDRRDVLRSVFSDRAHLFEYDGDAIQFVVESPVMRLIAIDSSHCPRQGGYLDDARLDWLEAALEKRWRTPTILAMHHPPFRTGVRYFDEQSFKGRDRLGSIVRANHQIRRIVTGHVHQVLRRPWCGTLAVSAPSTAPTVVLHPHGIGFSLESSGFLVHRYDWDGDVTTELVRLASEAVAIGA